MTLHIVQGDLFDPEFQFDAIGHGVNTRGNMGGGIAVAFREKWPEMYDEYFAMCNTYGTDLAGLIHIFDPEPRADDEFDPPRIYNLFSQIEPGRDGSYLLLRKALIMARQDAELNFYSNIGIPWVGCGIAGLDKHNVKFTVEAVFGDSDIDVIIVQPDEIMLP